MQAQVQGKGRLGRQLEPRAGISELLWEFLQELLPRVQKLQVWELGVRRGSWLVPGYSCVCVCVFGFTICVCPGVLATLSVCRGVVEMQVC